METRCVFIMIGLPGCGKTTLAKKINDQCQDIVHVDYDEIRTYINNGTYTFDPCRESDINSFGVYFVNKSLLSKNVPIIVDDCATFNTAKNRIKFCKQLLKDTRVYYLYFEECFISNTFRKECVIRRAKDTKGYNPEKWPPIINELYNAHNRVTWDELTETKAICVTVNDFTEITSDKNYLRINELTIYW